MSKEGIAKLDKAIKQLLEYKEWRRGVYTKDEYMCQICRKNKIYLQAHHKKHFKDLLKENNIKTTEDAIRCKELWSVNNGVTLCKKCHAYFRGRILWITGERDSGKTSLAKRVQRVNHRTINLDGDEMRWIWDDLGFSREDRISNNIRIAKLAKVLNAQGFSIVISTICPYKSLKDGVQKITNCKFINL